ncbi:putative RiPP precursor [Mesorhizobium sp. ArgA1]
MKKKTYEKPTLVKRGRLTRATAQIVASGLILGE